MLFRIPNNVIWILSWGRLYLIYILYFISFHDIGITKSRIFA